MICEGHRYCRNCDGGAAALIRGDLGCTARLRLLLLQQALNLIPIFLVDKKVEPKFRSGHTDVEELAKLIVQRFLNVEEQHMGAFQSFEAMDGGIEQPFAGLI